MKSFARTTSILKCLCLSPCIYRFYKPGMKPHSQCWATQGLQKACAKPLKTLIQTRAEGWRCIAGWHFQAFGPAMQTQLFTKICSSGQMPAERWCSNTGPRLHSFADGIQNKVELIAEFVTRLVNKGIYFWMCFYFSNISRKHINRAFTEKTYRSKCPVPYYLGGDP